jgi:hypothetical protein
VTTIFFVTVSGPGGSLPGGLAVLGVQPAARAVLLPRDGLLPQLLPHVLAQAALAAHHDSPQAADAGQQDFVPVL